MTSEVDFNTAALEIADMILFGERPNFISERENAQRSEDGERGLNQRADVTPQGDGTAAATGFVLVVGGQRFQIPEEGIVLGRDPGLADIVLHHEEVSRRHARVRRVAGGIEIVDLESANGTVVRRGEAIREVGEKWVKLTDGDRLVTRHGEPLAEIDQAREA